jgi:hypothetical protein
LQTPESESVRAGIEAFDALFKSKVGRILSKDERNLREDAHIFRQDAHIFRQDAHIFRQDAHIFRQDAPNLRADPWNLRADPWIFRDVDISQKSVKPTNEIASGASRRCRQTNKPSLKGRTKPLIVRPFQGRLVCFAHSSGVTAGAISLVAFSDKTPYLNRI